MKISKLIIRWVKRDRKEVKIEMRSKMIGREKSRKILMILRRWSIKKKLVKKRKMRIAYTKSIDR